MQNSSHLQIKRNTNDWFIEMRFRWERFKLKLIYYLKFRLLPFECVPTLHDYHLQTYWLIITLWHFKLELQSRKLINWQLKKKSNYLIFFFGLFQKSNLLHTVKLWILTNSNIKVFSFKLSSWKIQFLLTIKLYWNHAFDFDLTIIDYQTFL